jgi:hypothetical protein
LWEARLAADEKLSNAEEGGADFESASTALADAELAYDFERMIGEAEQVKHDSIIKFSDMRSRYGIPAVVPSLCLCVRASIKGSIMPCFVLHSRIFLSLYPISECPSTLTICSSISPTQGEAASVESY